MRLIDADALIECIRAHDYRLTIPYLNSTDNGMFTTGIEQAVGEQQTVGGWISVKDQLPDELKDLSLRKTKKPVLLYAAKDGAIYVGWYYGRDYRGVDCFISRTSMNAFQYITKKITYWMPLPPPPENTDT